MPKMGACEEANKEVILFETVLERFFSMGDAAC